MLTASDKNQMFDKDTTDYNLYIGTVKDSSDPNHQARLKVAIPEIYGSIPTESIPWAQPSSAFGGGDGYGIVFVPPVDSKVYITFWKGHRWMPIWHGTHWFQGELPEEARISPPKNYVIKSPEGHLIDLNDKNMYIRLKDKNGNFIILNADDDTIRIKVAEDLIIQTGENSSEKVGGAKMVSVGAEYDIFCMGNVNIRSSGVVNIDGASVNINTGLAHGLLPKDAEDVSHQ